MAIDKFEITSIKKEGRLVHVETNLGTGTGFGMFLDDNENNPDNRGLIVSMNYEKSRKPTVRAFLEANPMKSTIVIRKEVLKEFGIELTTIKERQTQEEENE